MRRRISATGSVAAAALALLAGSVTAAGAARGAPAPPEGPAAAPGGPDWVSWGQEVYRLESGETFQFTVGFAQIPARSWRLLVESDPIQGDLLVRRMADGSLLYASRNEARHDVLVPWGRGESIAVALSPGRLGGGVYTVTFLGPPPDALPVSYSYAVNRALEAFAAGRRDEARALCEQAITADAGDGAACVLLAGLLRDAGLLARARALADQAVALDLTPEMRAVAVGLRDDLVRREPTPGGSAPASVAASDAPPPGAAGEGPTPFDVRLAAVDARLAAGDAAAALALGDSLLRADAPPPPPAQARLQTRRGAALAALGRRFAAVDAYTLALARAATAREQAEIHLRLGRLFVEMHNPAQARLAFALARRQGLPPDLDAEARRAIDALDQRKD